MLKEIIKHGILFTAILFGLSGLVYASDESSIVPLQERIAALQSGGHFLVMRHAATDHSQKDLDRGAEAPCSMQRDLSEEGRLDMRRLGRSLEALGIQIDKVYSSPYCRAKHTAEEAFGSYEVLKDLEFSISKDKVESKRLADFLCGQLRSAPVGVGNMVFVSHTSNIRDCLGIWPKVEGAALVVEKRGQRLVYKGTINPPEWPLVGN